MTCSVLRISAIALGAAAFVSLYPLSGALADASTPSGAASATNGATSPPNAAAPSLSEPAPTPGWAESGPASAGTGATAVHPTHVYARRYARHYPRRYAWRNGRRYVRHGENPVAVAATGVVGGVADLGSLAAYPFYCFPNYGSCPVEWPYRY